MKSITANELKTKGVTSIDQALKDQDEAVISVRGRQKYVVMDMDAYNRLRVCELEAAYHQARKEVDEGKEIVESVDEHLARLKDMDE